MFRDLLYILMMTEGRTHHVIYKDYIHLLWNVSTSVYVTMYEETINCIEVQGNF